MADFSLRQSYPMLFAAFIAGAVITALILTQSKQSATDKDHAVLFEYNGTPMSAADLPAHVKTNWQTLEQDAHKKKVALLKNAALNFYYVEVAKQKGIEPGEAAAELLDLTPPSEEEIRAFYDSNNVNRPFQEVRNEIGRLLFQQRKQQAEQALLEQISQQKGFHIALTEPQALSVAINTEGYPSKGSAQPKIEIVEFADYQCPHCKRAFATLQRIMDQHNDQVRFTYMDFPINRSGISRKISQGAYCADQQGQFWAYHDLAFNRQETLTMESVNNLAEVLELDLAAFEQCLASDTAAEHVNQSQQEAIRLGLRGTPAIFIDGIRYDQGNLADDLEAAVAAALANHG